MTVKNGVKAIVEAVDAALHKHTKAAPKGLVMKYELTEMEMVTRAWETPRI